MDGMLIEAGCQSLALKSLYTRSFLFSLIVVATALRCGKIGCCIVCCCLLVVFKLTLSLAKIFFSHVSDQYCTFVRART